MSSYTIPNVIAQHPRGERVMDVYSHLLAERVIYLGTGIDAGVANALIAQLLHLDADSPETGVQFYINSEGGDPGAALAIYDTMQHIRPRVATTCVGQAIGPAALLVAAGAPGERAALTHARIVLHQPAGQSRGAIPDLILAADEVVRVRSDMEEILARHGGRTIEELRIDTDRDRVFTAEAAREYGLIDTVLGARDAHA
ncbi:ClpP family protease [Microbacterium sp. p3-SID336]|uniref:ClpP family protease n=1 Tax=Microbacterium sp. p3-SID336 TaxID=2916212 RepID=UPI0021A4F896|nr:ATP-dependent Clp protease proteolytic subunit [Microbacterium sp. p3-SID336]MCT1478436.1 ATP-dependent Clp protease proteolytic subunit [Microbacterium sp. p3-SID336]